ncbi:MAG: hypothetical protein IPG17_01820 [Sandaracinaceae bacterium]|nr:hypothetical protein [Sandaracinaceae bacterium]
MGSTRELNGQRIRVGGFTWGLVPFGPPYAFADIDLAREVTDVAVDRMNFVLVRVQPGMRPEDIRDAISPRVPEALVLTRDEYHTSIVTTLLASSSASPSASPPASGSSSGSSSSRSPCSRPCWTTCASSAR